MEVGDDVSQEIIAICKKWNEAEEAIKIAEQIVDEVVFPSINELRYAGRKFVDSMQLVSKNTSENNKDEIRKTLNDCTKYILCAKHDAYDAAIANAGLRLNMLKKELPAKIVLEVPNFTSANELIHEMDKKISDSRKTRGERDSIYNNMQDDLKKLGEIVNEIHSSEDLYLRKAREEKRNAKIGWGISIVIGIAGIFAMITG